MQVVVAVHVSFREVDAAPNGAALEELGKRIPGFTMPNVTDLAKKRWAVLTAANASGMLLEVTAAEVVSRSPELQQQLDVALEARLVAAEQAAAAAAAAAEAAVTEARSAAAAAVAAAAEARSMRQELAHLKERLEEATDTAAQQEIACQVVLFGAKGLASLEEQRGDRAALTAAARAAVASGLPDIDPATITDAFLLRKPDNKPAPLVMVCNSVQAKVALLRAARAASLPSTTDSSSNITDSVSLAARLTRWQQQRRVALKPQLEQLKAQGATVRLWQGHRLQRQDGHGWVDVPLASPASAAE